MKIALYLRVSTGEQSVENQERELLDWALRAGHEVVEIYRDEGVSGATSTRPGLDAMMIAARRREFQMVAAWSLDRMGRSLKHLVELFTELTELEIKLFTHKEAIDTSTAAGKLYLHMMGALAEFERERIRERSLAGQARARAAGKSFGSHAHKKPCMSVETRTRRIRECIARGMNNMQIVRELRTAKRHVIAERRKVMGEAA